MPGINQAPGLAQKNRSKTPLVLNLESSVGKALAVVGVILGAIIGLTLLAGFLPSMFDATASITENVSNGDVGNEQANTLLSVFGIVVPIVIIAGLVGVIFLVAKFKK